MLKTKDVFEIGASSSNASTDGSVHCKYPPCPRIPYVIVDEHVLQLALSDEALVDASPTVFCYPPCSRLPYKGQIDPCFPPGVSTADELLTITCNPNFFSSTVASTTEALSSNQGHAVTSNDHGHSETMRILSHVISMGFGYAQAYNLIISAELSGHPYSCANLSELVEDLVHLQETGSDGEKDQE
ncbi:unnamed protein product [Clavelina lepadiformis]|uniref:Uncharacterized protein n=1 Tax=Clavelina lepadiformis TaxID=159417 RepID=A0ABP0F7F9_CLALP